MGLCTPHFVNGEIILLLWTPLQNGSADTLGRRCKQKNLHPPITKKWLMVDLCSFPSTSLSSYDYIWNKLEMI